MPMVYTIHGDVDEALLARTVGFEDRPSEFVVWVEWRLAVDAFASVAAGQSVRGDLVRRDAHVILKTPSVVADAVCGGLS